MRTAVTVSASKKADNTAELIRNKRDSSFLFFTLIKSFVKMNKRKSFMKYIPATIKTSSKITFKLRTTS